MRIRQFETRYRTAKVGNEYIEQSQDWVLLAASPDETGNFRTESWHRVDKLRPPASISDNAETKQAMNARWEKIGPAYKAWKAGNEIPVDGTPLAAWPGLTKQQLEVLRHAQIRTIEELIDMGETAASLPIPGGRKLPELAADFMANKQKAAVMDELAAANARIAQMEEMLAEKPKRGRPKKEVEAA